MGEGDGLWWMGRGLVELHWNTARVCLGGWSGRNGEMVLQQRDRVGGVHGHATRDHRLHLLARMLLLLLGLLLLDVDLGDTFDSLAHRRFAGCHVWTGRLLHKLGRHRPGDGDALSWLGVGHLLAVGRDKDVLAAVGGGMAVCHSGHGVVGKGRGGCAFGVDKGRETTSVTRGDGGQ
jgi:hypothetical protein